MPSLRKRYVLNTATPQSTGVLLDTSNTFMASGIRFDNYSGKWLKLDSEGIFIPPYTSGYVIDTFVDTLNLKVLLQAPVSLIGAQVNNGPVIISVYEGDVFPDTGTRVAVGEVQAQTNVISPIYSFNNMGAIAAGEVLATGFALNQVFDNSSDGNGAGTPFGAGWSMVPGMNFVSGRVQTINVAYTTMSLDPPYLGVNIPKLLMLGVSFDKSGLVEFQLSGAGVQLWKMYVMANTPYNIPLPFGGLWLGLAGQNFQGRHSNGAANVATVVGWGP